MIFLIIPVSIFYGLPLARLLLNRRLNYLETMFWGPILAAAQIAIVGSMVLGAGASQTFLIGVLSLLWIIEVLCVFFFCASHSSTKRDTKWELLASAVIALIVVGIGVPTYGGPALIGTPLRIGPDIIGNAVASTAIAEEVSLKKIEREILASTDTRTLDEAFDYENHRVYEALNLRTQVRTEFLLAGLRWGLPLFASLPIRALGSDTIWVALPLLSLFALFVSGIGAILLAKLLRQSGIVSIVFAILTVTPPILLNGLYEGGASQIWSYQFIFAVLLAINSPIREWRRLCIATISLAAIMITYADLWTMLVVVAVIWLVFEVLRTRKFAKLDLMLLASLPLSVIAANSVGFRYSRWIFGRLSDAGSGGWSMPHWMTPAEILGVVNSFNQLSVTGIIPRGQLLSFLNSYFNPILIGLGLGLMIASRARRMTTLTLAAVTFLTILYVKTRYVDQVSNYQFFKAAGCLIPLLWLPVICMGNPSSTIRRQKLHSLIFLCVLATLISSASYLVSYTSARYFISQPIASTLTRTESRKFLSSINLVAPLTGQTVAMSALSDLNWFGRGAFGKIEGVEADSSRPLYLVVMRSDCPDWSCLRTVPQSAQRELGPELVFIRLSDSSASLVSIDQGPSAGTELFNHVQELLTRAGGPNIDTSFRPLGPANQ